MSSFDPNQSRPPAGGGNGNKPVNDEKTKELTAKRNRESYVLIVLFIGAMLISMYRLPWSLFAGLFAVAGIIWTVRYITAAVRAKQGPGWVAFTVIAFLGFGYCLLGALGSTMTYSLQSTYQECTASALTDQASQSCTNDYNTGVQNMLKSITQMGQTK